MPKRERRVPEWKSKPGESVRGTLCEVWRIRREHGRELPQMLVRMRVNATIAWRARIETLATVTRLALVRDGTPGALGVACGLRRDSSERNGWAGFGARLRWCADGGAHTGRPPAR